MGREVSSSQYAGKGCDDDGAESIMGSRNSSLLLLLNKPEHLLLKHVKSDPLPKKV